MNWETLMCFGDSITIGARSYCGYPEYAGARLERELDNTWNVINHAVCGYTTMGLARSITADFNNLKSFNASIVTIMIGTNDLKNNTPLRNIEIAYNQIITKALLIANSGNIVLLKIPYLSEKVKYPYTVNMNSQAKQINELITTLASTRQIRTFEFQYNQGDFVDGVHLNESGSEAIGNQLAQFILRDKGVYLCGTEDAHISGNALPLDS